MRSNAEDSPISARRRAKAGLGATFRRCERLRRTGAPPGAQVVVGVVVDRPQCLAVATEMAGQGATADGSQRQDSQDQHPEEISHGSPPPADSTQTLYRARTRPARPLNC